MRYLLLSLLLVCSASFAADFRIGVGVEIGPRVVAPPPVTIVQREELVWVPPAYETRVDEEGNVYTVLVRQGYYIRQVRPVYVAQPAPLYWAPCPSPSLGFFFGFGGGRGHCSPPPGPRPHGGSHR